MTLKLLGGDCRSPPPILWGMADGWAKATAHSEQISPGAWQWWVTWHDGTNERRVPFRPMRNDEARCDLRDGSLVCCLPERHQGPHVSIYSHSMPFVIAP